MVTGAALRVPLRTFSASAREIFWMIEDLFKPVPAAGAPAFWTKKTSSRAGCLLSVRVRFRGPEPDELTK